MNKIFTLLLTFFLFGNLLAQQDRLNAGELYAGSGYNGIVPLQWEELGNPTEYHVYRKDGTSDFSQIAVVQTGFFSSASYIDENVTAGIEYTYTIKDESDVGMTNQMSAIPNNTGHSITIPGWGTTTPTIDGSISGGEWGDAIQIDITNHARIFTTEYFTGTTVAYLKVANDKLFIAIKDYNGPTREQNDQTMIFFDYNNDNLWTGSDTDQRYLASWLDASGLYSERSEIEGTYPTTSFGSGEMQPSEFNAAIEEGTGFLVYEFSIDITGSPLFNHTDNFGMLLQTSSFESGSNVGLTGLFSPGGIWKAPSTFINCTVQYDADVDAPAIDAVSSLTQIINNPMDIVLTVSDQSEIQTITGTYTIEGGNAQALNFNPSRGVYGYSATIPAEATAVTGALTFYVEDIHGNSLTTTDYSIEWIEDNTAPTITPILTPTVATPTNLAKVTAEIFDNLSGVETVTLFYTINSGAEQSMTMSLINEIYTANFNDQVVGTRADYFIKATDFSGNNEFSETFSIVWYDGAWQGNITGQNTGNNFGSSGTLTMGLVLDLGSFEGQINKLGYMVPEFFAPPFSWKIVELTGTGENTVWTNNILVPEQTVTDNLIVNASSWSEIDVQSDVVLTGTIGLVLNLSSGSYWGRDANSTDGISWFLETSSGQWKQLGVGDWATFSGDWTLKAHFYDDQSVEVKELGATSTGLHAYPNPFNARTCIEYENYERGNVTLRITDISGKMVALPFSKFQEKGTYSYEYTNSLSPGTYFYTLTTKSKSTTKKMLVVK